MPHKIFIITISIVFLSFVVTHAQNEHIDQNEPFLGHLVIAGGGMEAENHDFYVKLINLAGGPENASFAIIPAAGGVPMQSYVLIRSTLLSYGVEPKNIHLIPIAMVDDDSTLNVDESKWKDNSYDIKLAEDVRKCSCVWFTGGDQSRITKLLYKQNCEKTPVLEAVWDVYNRGGVVGGTSAGAAMMSHPMIASGTSMGALTWSDSDEQLVMAEGLGFFKQGIVDQHFNERARLGRLITALWRSGFTMGYGVDENTALCYTPVTNKFEVVGASGVTIIDASKAIYNMVSGKSDTLMSVENVTIHYLTTGDMFDITTGAILPASYKSNLLLKIEDGHQRPIESNYDTIIQNGLLTSYNYGFVDILTEMANRPNLSGIQNLNYINSENAIKVVLSRQSNFSAFSGQTDDENEKYLFSGVRMDIEPVRIEYHQIKTVD
jgi:cyanophycinase